MWGFALRLWPSDALSGESMGLDSAPIRAAVEVIGFSEGRKCASRISTDGDATMRNSSNTWQVLAPLLLVGLAGCNDAMTSPKHGGLPAMSMRQGSGVIEETPPEVQFTIAARIVGSISVARPIQVQAEILSKFDIGDADLRIVAPELEIAKSSPRGATLPLTVGRRAARLAEQRGRLSLGQTARLAATLVADEPGYYRVVVSANAADSTTPTLVQTAVHKELWILVTDSGGVVMDEYRPELIGPEWIRQPGPFRARQSTRSGASLLTPGQTASSYSGDGNDYYRFVYFNNDLGTYVPVPDVNVRVTSYREEFGNNVQIGYGMHQSSMGGEYSVPCSELNNGEWYEGTVWLSNSRISIQELFEVGFIGGGSGSCGAASTPANPMTVILVSNESHVFRQMTLDADASRAFFNRQRGHLWVRVLTTAVNDVSSYQWLHDRVVIRNPSNQGIWGPYGRFTVGHEYGHAFHEKGLGGIETSCSGAHYLHVPSSLACAMGEGFANYHAAAVGSTYGSFENTDYTKTDWSCSGPNCARDGSTIEGAVASFLFNLSDPPNATSDSVHYPGRYVADLVESCRNFQNPPNSSVPLWGVDHLVYCAERTTDQTVRTNYFSTRVASSLFFWSEGASEPANWNASHIRRLWLWTLYRQTSSTPPPPPPPTYTVSILGPEAIQPGMGCNWQAVTDVPDAQYLWEVNNAQIGTFQTVNYSSGSSFTLSLTVSNNSGVAITTGTYISVDTWNSACYDM